MRQGSASHGAWLLVTTTVLVVAALALALSLGTPAGYAAAKAASPFPAATPSRDDGTGDWFRDACTNPSNTAAGCGVQVVSNSSGTPLASNTPPSGAYGPTQFHTGYNLPTTAASGTPTIAIVDAYDDPDVESDLAAYDSYYHLPACTTANGCFTKINQTGGSTYPSGTSWSLEIALDVETAHEICQNCKILLVEANSASYSDLGAAVNEAVAQGANVVSNSYGGSEFSGETSLDTAYYKHPGVVITASAGDSGYGVEYPAASPYVTAVGGTTLELNANNTYKSETAWSGSGSGCSAYEPKPSWQTDTGCSRRMVADVSADADPNTGAAVYDSVGTSGGAAWYQVGGTSLSAPLVGAVYALTGSTNVNYGSTPYAHAASLNDVVSGSNGTCSVSYECTARAGYDGPTGLGTPNGVGAFSTQSFSLAASPSSVTATAGAAAAYTITISGHGGFAGTVAFSASGLPAGATATFTPVSATKETLSIQTTLGSTPPGSSSFTITGTSSGVANATASATIKVQQPTFTLAVSPSSATAVAGSAAAYTIAVTAHTGFSGTVNLSVTGLPAGASASFATVSATKQTMTVETTYGTTPAGSSPLTISGTSAGVANATASATLKVTVPRIAISPSPASRTASAGTAATYTVTVTRSGGLMGSVTLGTTGLPDGVSATFGPSATTSTSKLSIDTSTLDPGTYPFTITGTSTAISGVTGSIAATLVVAAAPAMIVSASTAAPSAHVTVAWAGLVNPTTTDWIGLYDHGTETLVSRVYTSSCTTTAGSTAKGSGSCSIKLPSAAGGTYDFRLFTHGTSSLLATSAAVTTS